MDLTNTHAHCSESRTSRNVCIISVFIGRVLVSLGPSSSHCQVRHLCMEVKEGARCILLNAM